MKNKLKEIDTFFKYLLKGMIIFLIFWYSKYLQYIPLKIFNIKLSEVTDNMLIVLSLFSSLVLVVIFSIIYRKDLKRDFKDFIKHKGEYTDIGVRYWVIGLLLMMVCNYILNVILKAGGANNEKAVQEMIRTIPALMLIDAGLVAPFNEEIVFRKTLKDTFKNKWVFIILSFLLFGAVHVIGSAKVLTDYLYIIPYGILGASFAISYYKTNNVFTPITMHMIHNIILITISIVLNFIR